MKVTFAHCCKIEEDAKQVYVVKSTLGKESRKIEDEYID